MSGRYIIAPDSQSHTIPSSVLPLSHTNIASYDLEASDRLQSYHTVQEWMNERNLLSQRSEMPIARVLSVTFLSLFFLFSLIAVSVLWCHLNPFLDNYFFMKLKVPLYNKFDLQTILTNPNEARTVTNSRFKNPTVIRRVGNGDEEPEEGLARARDAIRQALRRNISFPLDNGENLSNDVYHNPSEFYQSYAEMEKRFNVYVYPDGDPPFIHDGPCKDLYTVEGRFIQEMEFGDNMFRTKDPHRAHVYFMPYSVTMMVSFLYKHDKSYDTTPLQQFVSGYLRAISTKYPYWNRSQGADHFTVACHDWGPDASRGNPFLYNNSIRVLCNANTSEGFNPQKDATLPEIYLYDGTISPELHTVPPEDGPRPYLAFFAGGSHGSIRHLLFKHWQGKDDDIRVFQNQRDNYYTYMLQSSFCLCPSGYEVASPRVVEAIYAECVPVIISENYVLPFSDVLRWESFSVQVDVSDIPNLKKKLKSISEEEYRKLKKAVRAVKRHFVLNQPPKQYDVFHMILHSIWLRRLNVRLARD